MRGLAGAIASLINIGSMAAFAEPHHTRRGRKSNRYPSGGNRAHAPFNTEADAVRAVRRAKRWLRNQSKGPEHIPPRHIFVNAELAVAQYGEGVAQLADDIV